MSRRGREAALRIQLLLEEFTRSELEEGLSLIGAAEGGDVLAFLQRKVSAASPRAWPRSSTKPTGEYRSREIREVKRAEPEKYRLLRDFEARVRDGSVLPTLDSLRMFGKELSKDFEPAKSRKESVGRLLRALAALNLDDVRAAISRAPSYGGGEGAEPYRRLATHIISGPSR